MFEQSHFEGDVSAWNVAKGKSFHCMFKNTTFNGDLSRWDVSRGSNFGWMFEKSEFNGRIGMWNMAQARDLTAMFSTSAFEQDVGAWAIGPSTKTQHIFQGNTGAFSEQTPTAWVVNAFVQEHALDADVDWAPALLEYRQLRGALGLLRENIKADVVGIQQRMAKTLSHYPLDGLIEQNP